MFVFSPYFSRIMGIHFSHVLGIVWISASSKIFKKPINLKCLCFPILFPYNGNPLFPYFGNCMDFCFKQKIPETLNLEMFVFFHIFPLLWEFPFPIFWEFYRFLLYLKYFRNSTLWNVCVFPYFFLTMGISFSHILGIAWISASSETFKTPKNLKCLCVFPFFSPYNGNPLFLCLGNCMDFCFTQNI